MKKYLAQFLSYEPTVNNVRLSPEFVHKILVEQPQLPVTVDFTGRGIGQTLGFAQEGNRILCRFEADEKRYPFFHLAYLVPGFDQANYHWEGRTKVIDSAILTEACVTFLPADLRQTRIQEGE